jgi:predicted flap endonuclease-1-like 5' DNA nuclease
MSYPINDIEGIGPKFTKMLKKVGVTQTKHLLNRGASKKGRKDLAKESGLKDTQILKWANMADLMRIRGVGEEYSELLEAAGVDTVKELRNRNPENLRETMVTKNAKKKLVRQLPGPKQVKSWVVHAKKLKPTITY